MDDEWVADLFENTFKFRGLNDWDVYYQNDQEALIGNYWGIFHKLNSNLIAAGKIERAKSLLEKMHTEIDIGLLPFKSDRTVLIDIAQKGVTGMVSAGQLVDTLKIPQQKMQVASLISDLYSPSDYAEAILQQLWETAEMDQTLQNIYLENYLKYYINRNQINKAAELIETVKENDPQNSLIKRWEKS